jgi:hypothetical protein
MRVAEVTGGDPGGFVGPQQLMSLGADLPQPAGPDRPPVMLAYFNPSAWSARSSSPRPSAVVYVGIGDCRSLHWPLAWPS